MFITTSQLITTDMDYTRIRSSYEANTAYDGDARITISFGNYNSLRMTITEAKQMFLELEISLREAYDAEEAND